MRVIYGPMFALGIALASSQAAAKPMDITFLSKNLEQNLNAQDPISVANVGPSSLLSPTTVAQPLNTSGATHSAFLPETLEGECLNTSDANCASSNDDVQGHILSAPNNFIGQGIAGWNLANVSTGQNQDLPSFKNAELASYENETENAQYRLPTTDCGITCPTAASEPVQWTDHVPKEYATHPGFWDRVKSVRTESLLFLGYFGIMSGNKLFKETKPFHFKDEGWFGKDTANIGVDKLTHAFNTYLLAEFLHNRMHHNTGASHGDAVTAAVLASGLMMFNELSDGIETDSGWSVEDVISNFIGAGFSVLRNTVPGMKEKVSFKVEVVPNNQIYSHVGKKHYEQQRFMLSLKGSGFEGLQNSPLKYLDLQVGYYASNFLHSDRAAGIEPKRHLFVGVGLNLGEIFFGQSQSRFGKAAYSFLDYFQVPYTSIRYDTTGRLGT